MIIWWKSILFRISNINIFHHISFATQEGVWSWQFSSYCYYCIVYVVSCEAYCDQNTISNTISVTPDEDTKLQITFSQSLKYLEVSPTVPLLLSPYFVNYSPLSSVKYYSIMSHLYPSPNRKHCLLVLLQSEPRFPYFDQWKKSWFTVRYKF